MGASKIGFRNLNLTRPHLSSPVGGNAVKLSPHLYCRRGLGLTRDLGLGADRPGRLRSRVRA